MNAVENNRVTIVGIMTVPFSFDHEAYGEKFYRSEILSPRRSGAHDSVPIIVSERVVDVTEDYSGLTVKVTGQFRSHNTQAVSGKRLILFVFANDIEFFTESINSINNNSVFLDGFVCRKPNYRTTPNGRSISDLLLAVNRPYRKKSDYIPCIVWGRNATFASRLEIGTRISVEGRIQSRIYTKKLSETELETLTAYELSVSKIDIVEE